MKKRNPEKPSFVLKRMDSLKAERKVRGLTIPELSAETGVSVTMLRRYDEGTALPSMEKYNKLAEYFGWEAWE